MLYSLIIFSPLSGFSQIKNFLHPDKANTVPAAPNTAWGALYLRQNLQ